MYLTDGSVFVGCCVALGNFDHLLDLQLNSLRNADCILHLWFCKCSFSHCIWLKLVCPLLIA
ncbi:hypothetical protein JHK82_057183 [Glycine max]|nr:hypothetical protein JHK86_057008 [Glycine max]KAG5075840.1 hypothetical protein JHK84_057071 [Glycine max]KAG5078488.1 hypothetical protein JHK82_057183 [Glycine max]